MKAQESPNDWVARTARRLMQERVAKMKPDDVDEGLLNARSELRKMAMEHPDDVIRLKAILSGTPAGDSLSIAACN